MYNNRYYCNGNLTRDPEFKQIQTNGEQKELVTFRVAVNEPIGNGREETLYIDVDGWNHHVNYAKAVNLSKGDRVTITGMLKMRSWDGPDGTKRTAYSIKPKTFSKIVTPGSVQNSESF